MKAIQLSLFPLTMLIIGSIDSVRNLAATALFGSSLFFFMFLSVILFLIPTALISAELAAQDSENGGIYYWVKKAFGEKTALLAIWLQWINTMIWFPTILSFIAGTSAYLIDPGLAQSKWYLIFSILTVFWILTFLNLKGIKVSALFATFCTLIGVALPMVLILGLALIWILNDYPLQIHFGLNYLIPSLSTSTSWISLTAIITSFLGMELATIHINHVQNAKRTFPIALAISVIVIAATMLFCSLAIAIVIPSKEINLISGVIETFQHFFQAYHCEYLLHFMVFCIVIGSIGGMINWVVSPAKGLLQAAQDGFLPKMLQRENPYKVAVTLLIVQALLVSLISLAFLLMPSVNGSYWFLTDLSTQLYLLMYVIMFMAAIKLSPQKEKIRSGFTIPGGKRSTQFFSLVGISACLITMGIGFIPPDNINVGGTTHYVVLFIAAMLLTILPVLGFYQFRRRYGVFTLETSV